MQVIVYEAHDADSSDDENDVQPEEKVDGEKLNEKKTQKGQKRWMLLMIRRKRLLRLLLLCCDLLHPSHRDWQKRMRMGNIASSSFC